MNLQKALITALHEAVGGESTPSNPSLWEKILKLTRGDTAYMTHGGERIDGPNDGKGFKIYPSAYANAWAAKLYKKLGGKWKKISTADLREWFGKEDWVAITPVKRTITKKDGTKKTYDAGDIVGPCGVSNKPEWKRLTKDGKDPLKCLPRKKAQKLGKEGREETAKRKLRKEKSNPDTGKPVRSKT